MRLCFTDKLHLLFRIINQCRQSFFVLSTQRMSKNFLNFFLNRTGTILQHMGKRLVLSMNICQEMFCTFGKIQDCLQIDNLCRCFGNRRIQLRQTFHKSQFHRFHINLFHINPLAFFLYYTRVSSSIIADFYHF